MQTRPINRSAIRATAGLVILLVLCVPILLRPAKTLRAREARRVASRPPRAAILEASKRDSLIDIHMDGEVNEGDRIRYKIVIRNAGDAVAEGVTYSDLPDEFSALVPGTVATTPIARDDRFAADVNTQLDIGPAGVLANDGDPDGVGPPLTVTDFDATSSAGLAPNVTVHSDGGFSYNPPNGFVGTDRFHYTLSDGEGHSAQAQVEIDVRHLGLPRIAFLEVRRDDDLSMPCVEAEPCTIPTFTDFRVRFKGTSPNGRIDGYTWQVAPPRWEPFGTFADTAFLDLAMIEGDTLAYDVQGRPAWELSSSHDTVTVYLRSARDEPVLGGRFSGNLWVKARARDEAGLQSITRDGQRLITVNYDPDTKMFEVPECDCPTAPPDCDSQALAPAGWVTGIGEVDSFPVEDWRLFCAGDTLPNSSFVSFYATGWDDPRDLPIDPGATTLPEVSYRFRFEMRAAGFSSANMPLSWPARVPSDLRVPGGGAFRGAAIGWRTCPFDYLFHASSVDEHARVDGTLAELEFFVGGSPVIDSLHVPPVLVFVPTCPNTRAVFCPDYQNVSFGPDTLAVLGTSEPDASLPTEWQTPWGLGWNTFVLPFRAFGHDHPRDRNPAGGPVYYKAEEEGHIRSWKFSFDCTEPGCQDVVLGGEDVWRENRIPAGQGAIDIFDDVLTVARIPLDTLCVEDEGGDCSPTNARAVLSFAKFGTYRFEIQGRDTEFIGQTCLQPSDLGLTPAQFAIAISELGRTTATAVRMVRWRQLSDVRPIMKPAGHLEQSTLDQKEDGVR